MAEKCLRAKHVVTTKRGDIGAGEGGSGGERGAEGEREIERIKGGNEARRSRERTPSRRTPSRISRSRRGERERYINYRASYSLGIASHA